MKLVEYILKKVLPLFAGSVIFFSLVLNLVDLFMHIANYLQAGCKWADIFRVTLYYTPKTLWYAVPVGLLFATSYSLSDMYARNELEALFASGVSLFKFTLPLLIISLFFSFGLFIFENKVVVKTYQKKVDLQNQLLMKSNSENNSNVVVISDNGKIVYKARKYYEEEKRLQGLYLIFRDDENNLESIIYAQNAYWNVDEKVWTLDRTTEYDYENGKLEISALNYNLVEKLTESYEIFRNNTVDVQTVSVGEAKIYIDHLRKAGLPYHEQLSEYYKKFSFPFIVFLVVFLSIGLTGKTKKNVLLISLASSVSAVVLFYVFMMITMVFAKHGYISPFMGAWLPVFVFTGVSAVLFKFART